MGAEGGSNRRRGQWSQQGGGHCPTGAGLLSERAGRTEVSQDGEQHGALSLGLPCWNQTRTQETSEEATAITWVGRDGGLASIREVMRRMLGILEVMVQRWELHATVIHDPNARFQRQECVPSVGNPAR